MCQHFFNGAFQECFLVKYLKKSVTKSDEEIKNICTQLLQGTREII